MDNRDRAPKVRLCAIVALLSLMRQPIRADSKNIETDMKPIETYKN